MHWNKTKIMVNKTTQIELFFKQNVGKLHYNSCWTDNGVAKQFAYWNVSSIKQLSFFQTKNGHLQDTTYKMFPNSHLLPPALGTPKLQTMALSASFYHVPFLSVNIQLMKQLKTAITGLSLCQKLFIDQIKNIVSQITATTKCLT